MVKQVNSQMQLLSKLLKVKGGNKGHNKGRGKASAPAPAFGKARGKGKGNGAGQWLFVPAHGAPQKGTGKGKGGKASVRDSKFMDKLGKIDSSLKVWVGGLSDKTTWGRLSKHFKDADSKPSIAEILPKGKACLAFKTEDEAATAIASMNGTELDGKTIEVDVWTQKEKGEKREKPERTKKPKSVIKTAFAKNAGGKTRTDPKLTAKMKEIDNDLKMWVGGLNEETNAGAVRRHFTEAGCKPHLLNLTGKDRACVSFRTADEASSAITALGGTEIDGATIEVDVWTKMEKKIDA